MKTTGRGWITDEWGSCWDTGLKFIGKLYLFIVCSFCSLSEIDSFQVFGFKSDCLLFSGEAVISDYRDSWVQDAAGEV